MVFNLEEANQIHADLDQIRNKSLNDDLKIKDVVNYKSSYFLGRLWQNIVSLVTGHGLMSTRVSRALASHPYDSSSDLLRKKMLDYAANSKVLFDKMSKDLEAKINASQSATEVEKAKANIANLKIV